MFLVLIKVDAKEIIGELGYINVMPTWYISSPRAESCSSVVAAVNSALKA